MMVATRRPGRPAGSGGENKRRVLEAAREEFASKGYSGATIRAIAARAGVDVALVAHYFGNKEGLFAVSLELPAAARDGLWRALDGPQDTLGEQLTREYLGLWEDPATRPQMVSLVRSAMGNEAAAARLRETIVGVMETAEIDARVAAGRAGFALAITQLLGAAVARHIVGVPPLATLDIDALVARLAPTVQSQLDG